MSIDSLRDGFVTLCLNTSLNNFGTGTKMLVEGQFKSSTGSAASVAFTETGSNNFTNGDTLVIGNTTLHLVSTIGSTAGNVLIGGTFALTVANIIAALNASQNAGANTANYITPASPANASVSSGSGAFTATARAVGAAGNSLASTYTAAGTSAGSFASATLAGGTDATGESALADVPIKVNSVNDIDGLFTPGTVIAESLRKAFLQSGPYVEMWALPRADNNSGVAAVYTMTIAGPATSDGVFSLFMLDGEYIIEVPVASGDTAASIAASVVAEIPYNFPYTAVAASGVITFTAINKGTVGNYLAPVYNYLGLQNYAPAGVTVSIVATTPGSGNPAPLNYDNVLGGCCYAVFALLTDDLTWQKGMENYIRAQWACNIPAGFAGAKPQCFGHGYTYNSGTLGTVLDTGNNAEVWNRWAQPLNDPNAPYLLVAAYAALSASQAFSPEEAIQGPVDGVLTAISRPTSCSEPWSYQARLTLFNAGFVTWGPVSNNASQLTNPYVYADITNSLTNDLNQPNATWQSTATRRWAANFSNKLAQFLDGTFNGLSVFSDGTKIKPGIFGTTRNMMRAKIIQWLNDQAGVTISSLQNVDTQVVLTSDLDTAPPCLGKPGNFALNLIVQPPVRINNIATTLYPQLLTNCNNTQFSQANQLFNQ